VAPRVTKRSTGIAYGAKADTESDVRADRHFRHPNVPTYKTRNRKTGMYENERAYQVDRTTGLVESLGAAFFGQRAHSDEDGSFVAPAVGQLSADALHRRGKRARLLVFGFHMLSAKKNVHGGYELDDFVLHLLGRTENEASALNKMARDRMEEAGAFASAVAKALQRALQMTAGAGVRAREHEDGRIIVEKSEIIRSSDYAFGRDLLADFWRVVQQRLREFATRIAEIAEEGPAGLAQARETLQLWWEDTIAHEAWRLYLPVFGAYSTLPRNMPYAHAARRIFSKALQSARTIQTPSEST
jgi:hypothetical protein